MLLKTAALKMVLLTLIGRHCLCQKTYCMPLSIWINLTKKYKTDIMQK